MKSSFLERISLLKVLQELLRPWYKSASSHRPNRPLKIRAKGVEKSFASAVIVVTELEGMSGIRPKYLVVHVFDDQQNRTI